jgi:hypothetical protein
MRSVVRSERRESNARCQLGKRKDFGRHRLLIPGTTDAGHLEANIAAGMIEFDNATLAALDAVESQSIDVALDRARPRRTP